MRVTRFNDLNDPFELLAVELLHHEERLQFSWWRRSVDAKFGLFCFSKRWQLSDLIPENNRPEPLFCMKFSDWKYEDECRRIITLADAREDGAHHFWIFGPDLMLRQVIAGPRSKVTKGLLKEIFGDDLKHAQLTKARLAWQTFRVVANLRGWRQLSSRTGTPAART